jgi:hypothetical protein
MEIQMSLSVDPMQLREEKIRKRAYEMYLSREGQEGDEVSDWLAAEREFNKSSDQPEPKKTRAATASR